MANSNIINLSGINTTTEEAIAMKDIRLVGGIYCEEHCLKH